MRRFGRLTMPFLALGLVFLALGLVLDDSRQLYFGVVWLVIAAVALLWRVARRTGSDRSDGISSR